MADRIVIVGSRRGNARIPPHEIIQMLGRCGRRPGEKGVVDVIADIDDMQPISDALQSGKGMEVRSTMTSRDTLAFHLLAEVSIGRVKCEADAVRWFSRSLAAKTTGPEEVMFAWQWLNENGFVSHANATDIGMLSVKLYFHPLDILGWRENFQTVFTDELEGNDVAVAWAASHVPSGRNRWHCDNWEAIGEFTGSIDSLGLDATGTVGWNIAWWSALGGPRPPDIGNAVSDIRRDIGRHVGAFKWLNRVYEWEKEGFFDAFEVRAKKGIESSMSGLCSIHGITKSMACELFEMGVENADEITEKWDIISATADESFVERLEGLGFGH